MLHLTFFVIATSLIVHVNSYVLLQVRKQDDNVSKVDALIHKTVSNTKIDELKDRISRKSYRHNENDRLTNNDRTIDNVVLAGVKKLLGEEKQSDLVDEIAQKIVSFVKENAGPIYRTLKKSQSHVDPKEVHFRNEKPSVMLKFDSSTFVDMVENALKSDKLNHYINHFTKRAAVAYLDVKDKVVESLRRNNNIKNENE